MSDDLRERVGEAALKGLLDRRGLREPLQEIKRDDPEVWSEIVAEAADAALAEMGGVRVKPLKWDERHRADNYRIQYTYGQDQKDYLLTRGSNVVWAYDTVDEAKAAAQADYETRILAAIELAPSVQGAARLLLDALNEESELDDVIQTAMQEEADTDGTDEWVFVLRAGLRAIAERKE